MPVLVHQDHPPTPTALVIAHRHSPLWRIEYPPVHEFAQENSAQFFPPSLRILTSPSPPQHPVSPKLPRRPSAGCPLYEISPGTNTLLPPTPPYPIVGREVRYLPEAKSICEPTSWGKSAVSGECRWTGAWAGGRAGGAGGAQGAAEGKGRGVCIGRVWPQP